MHSLEEFVELGGKPYGHYVAMICPWHDDHKPSLFVYEDDTFRCSACGVWGTHDRLYEKLENPHSYMPATEGASYRPPRVPDNLEAFATQTHNLLKQYEYRQSYLTRRGVRDMIDKVRIGWFEGWYTVPVVGEAGAVEGMVLRAGPALQEKTGLRFLQPYGQKPMPFFPDRQLVQARDELFIVFGIFDALVLAELGYPVVTTTGGKNTFDPAWLEDYRRHIVIVPDEDEEEAAYKVARRLGWRGQVLFIDYPEDCKDPADFVLAEREDELKTILGGEL